MICRRTTYPKTWIFYSGYVHVYEHVHVEFCLASLGTYFCRKRGDGS
jgi:hypothetical protein